MLKTIDVKKLRVGMYLCGLPGSWLQNPFWRTARLLDSQEDVDRILQSEIRHAIINTLKGCDVEFASDPELAPSTSRFVQSGPTDIVAPGGTGDIALNDELTRAAAICLTSRKAVKMMFNEVRMGAAISPELTKATVGEITESVMRNTHALISLARLKTSDDYTYMHCVSVCALMVAVARELGLDDRQIQQAGHAGLTHDIGKMEISAQILNKPGKLNDAEFIVVKEHPVAGHRLLQQAGIRDEVTLDVCLHHHEKMNGSGYPYGLAGDQISLFARIGAVCDIYDAVTSDRPYKTAWGPAEAIKKMASWSDGHFDPTVFKAFVKTVGIYPVGTLVKLSSGRLGVVVDQHEKSLLTPTVRVFFSSKSSTYITPILLDLAAPGEREKIVGYENAAQWRLTDIDRFWQ